MYVCLCGRICVCLCLSVCIWVFHCLQEILCSITALKNKHASFLSDMQHPATIAELLSQESVELAHIHYTLCALECGWKINKPTIAAVIAPQLQYLT